MIAEGGGIRATGRALGVDKDTVQRWVERAGQHGRGGLGLSDGGLSLEPSPIGCLVDLCQKKDTQRNATDDPQATG